MLKIETNLDGENGGADAVLPGLSCTVQRFVATMAQVSSWGSTALPCERHHPPFARKAKHERLDFEF